MAWAHLQWFALCVAIILCYHHCRCVWLKICLHYVNTVTTVSAGAATTITNFHLRAAENQYVVDSLQMKSLPLQHSSTTTHFPRPVSSSWMLPCCCLARWRFCRFKVLNSDFRSCTFSLFESNCIRVASSFVRACDISAEEIFFCYDSTSTRKQYIITLKRWKKLEQHLVETSLPSIVSIYMVQSDEMNTHDTQLCWN